MLARLTNEIINEISELHQMFIFNNDESAMVKISLPSVFGLDKVFGLLTISVALPGVILFINLMGLLINKRN